MAYITLSLLLNILVPITWMLLFGIPFADFAANFRLL